MATYIVQDMRVSKPTPAMRAKHPDRAATIYGKFYSEEGAALTIRSLTIGTNLLALMKRGDIDEKAGTVTLPDRKGQGHKALAGLDAEGIDSLFPAIEEAAAETPASGKGKAS
jgi:hypothetical protein